MNKTGYFTHADCRRHDMGPGHPECPERLDAIEDRLLMTGVGDVLDRREAPLAALSDIELAHDHRLVAALQGLSSQLADGISAGGPAYVQLDPDTAMNAHTWNAVLRAAGATLAATDAVMAGELENALCAVRPPGHLAVFFCHHGDFQWLSRPPPWVMHATISLPQALAQNPEWQTAGNQPRCFAWWRHNPATPA